MEFLPFEQLPLLLLFLVGLVAGTIDAIAGGGGLLTLPALLASGLSPLAAIATAKLQSTAGTLSAVICYHRRGLLEWRPLLPALPWTLAGSAAGVLFLRQIDPQQIKTLLPLLFLLVAGYFVVTPQVGELRRQQRIGERSFAVAAGGGIGFYDGFLGPGTGTFFAVSFVSLLGYELRRATAAAKLLNVSSNLVALLLFIYGGEVVWSSGLAMSAGQILGGRLGAGLALQRGANLIRPLVVIMCLASVVKGWGSGYF